MNNNNFLFTLNYLANILQVCDFQLNISQLTNDDIMKHLLEQDDVLNMQNKALDEQTNNYLEKIVNQNKIIIEQNNEILNLLKGGSKNAH